MRDTHWSHSFFTQNCPVRDPDIISTPHPTPQPAHPLFFSPTSSCILASFPFTHFILMVPAPALPPSTLKSSYRHLSDDFVPAECPPWISAFSLPKDLWNRQATPSEKHRSSSEMRKLAQSKCHDWWGWQRWVPGMFKASLCFWFPQASMARRMSGYGLLFMDSLQGRANPLLWVASLS